MKFKKWAASVTAAVLLAGGLTVGGAVAAASAHTGDLDLIPVCNNTTGMYDITVKLTISQTGLPGQTRWRVGTSNFEGTPNNANGMSEGPVSSNGAGTVTLGKFSLPGTTTGLGPWVYAYTSWSDNYGKGSDDQLRQNESLPGTCRLIANDADASVSVIQASCTAPGSATVNLVNATIPGVLDTSVGTHTVIATATDGHLFSDGYSTKSLTYTVPDKNPGLCPTNQFCTTTAAGPVSTDLNDLWLNIDTRSKGHVEYVNDGLHVWTDDNSGQAKVSEGIAVNTPLKNVGQLAINATAQPGNSYAYGPGLNLFVDITGDGVADGTLVYETVYGQDLWVTSGSAQALKDASVHTGGNGSENHGTIDHYLQTFPNATVVGLAYSLGSGVHGDWVIDSIVFGCTEYTFDKVQAPETPKPKIEITYTAWVDGQFECNDTTVAVTRTATTTTTPYKVIVVGDHYEVVEDTANIKVETDTETDVRQLDASERTVCVVATEPTATDKCAVANDTVNLPDVEGVTYEVEWSEDGYSSATVTATADEGYVLVPAEGDEGVVSEWTFEFTNEDCPVPPKDTPKGGLAQTGAEIGTGVLAALVLLLAGGVFLIARRRQNV